MSSNQYIRAIVSKKGSAGYHPLINSIKKIKNRHLPLKEMRITAKADQQRGKVQHGAIDVGIPVGRPVYAIADAIVVKIKKLPNSKAGIYKKHGGTSKSLCGSSVSLKVPHIGSPSGYSYVVYCHLSDVNTKLKEGQKIKGGTILGLSGGAKGAYGAGNTTGPHLHLSIRPGDSRFKSNSLSAENAVYETWFKNARVGGSSGIVKKISIWSGFAFVLAGTGYTLYKIITT